MNDIEVLENIITEYNTQVEDYKFFTVPVRLDETDIEALENAIKSLKERQSDKERIKDLEEINEAHKKENGELRERVNKIKQLKNTLIKEYDCAREGFMKKQIPTSVVDGTIVQELGWIINEIDKILGEEK